MLWFHAATRPRYFISYGPRVGRGEETQANVAFSLSGTSSAGCQDERALASAGDYVGAILSSCIPTATFFTKILQNSGQGGTQAHRRGPLLAGHGYGLFSPQERRLF